jgi:hypothetical protein
VDLNVGVEVHVFGDINTLGRDFLFASIKPATTSLPSEMRFLRPQRTRALLIGISYGQRSARTSIAQEHVDVWTVRDLLIGAFAFSVALPFLWFLPPVGCTDMYDYHPDDIISLIDDGTRRETQPTKLNLVCSYILTVILTIITFII